MEKLIEEIQRMKAASDEYLSAPDTLEDEAHEQGYNDALKELLTFIEQHKLKGIKS